MVLCIKYCMIFLLHDLSEGLHFSVFHFFLASMDHIKRRSQTRREKGRSLWSFSSMQCDLHVLLSTTYNSQFNSICVIIMNIKFLLDKKRSSLKNSLIKTHIHVHVATKFYPRSKQRTPLKQCI